MIIALEVTAPDSPRSIDVQTIRDAIVEYLDCELDGMEIELYLEADNGGDHQVRCTVSCIQELDTTGTGFYVPEDEV